MRCGCESRTSRWRGGRSTSCSRRTSRRRASRRPGWRGLSGPGDRSDPGDPSEVTASAGSRSGRGASSNGRLLIFFPNHPLSGDSRAVTHLPIGLLAFWKNYDRKLYLRAAELADDLGYDSFWIPEAWGYDAFILLAEMATRTKRIRLGTGIINVFSRTPGLIAMNAATVDEISEGRLILGLGTSAARVIEGFHGRPFAKPLTQVRDVIRVVRALLRGDKLHEAGAELVQYRSFPLAMNPVRREIPIFVAALKQKAIESIGELADGWIPTFWPYEQLQQGRAFIATGAARAGRDPAQVVTAPFTTVLPLAGDTGSHMAKDIIAFYIGGMGDYYAELLRGFGFGDECKRVEDLYRDKATRAQAAGAVSDGMLEALTIQGDPAHCVRELQRRRAFGIDHPILNLPVNMPWEVVEMFIRGLAPSA
ncbi:MAG: LLM class flavin-dependent oxidoreductase [Myxococcales bacterium]|nr:LLM class flavin-dependent oxidoreductase [Myxococcales bacterium]